MARSPKESGGKASAIRSGVAVITAVCLLTVLAIQGLRQIVVTNAAERIAREVTTERMLQCVADRAHKLVPDGSRIFIDVNDPAWIQRLTTLVYPRLKPVGNPYIGPRNAQFALGVISDPTSDCNGIRVFAKPL